MPEERLELDKDGNQVYQRPNEMMVFMWKKQWRRVDTHEAEYLKYQRTAYPIIMGQCSLALKVQLEGSKGYEKTNIDQDVVELLWLIWSICCQHEQNACETYAMVRSMKSFFYFYQKRDTSNDEYLKEFKARVESLDDFDACTFGKFPCLVKKKLSKWYNNFAQFCW